MKATMFDGHTVQPFTLGDTSVLSPDTPYAWVDIRTEGPDDPHVPKYLQTLGFSDLMTENAAKSYTAGAFMIMQGNLVGATWAASDDDGMPVLVHFAWNSARFVTIRSGGDAAMAETLRDVQSRGQGLFSQPTSVPGVVLQLIISSVSRRLTGISGQVADVDERIIESVKSSQLSDLRSLRGQLSPWSTRLPTYLDNLKAVTVDAATLPGMDDTGAQHLQSYVARVQDVCCRMDDLADDLRNVAQDYQTEISNKQGNRIDQLTIVSILFLPVTFLTGYFGMNFQWLVNETQSVGTWLVLGVILPILMVVGSAVALVKRGYSLRLFRRRRAQ